MDKPTITKNDFKTTKTGIDNHYNEKHWDSDDEALMNEEDCNYVYECLEEKKTTTKKTTAVKQDGNDQKDGDKQKDGNDGNKQEDGNDGDDNVDDNDDTDQPKNMEQQADDVKKIT